MEAKVARDILLGTLSLIFLALSLFAASQTNKHQPPTYDQPPLGTATVERKASSTLPSKTETNVPMPPEGQRALVTRVYDGDTIEVDLNGIKERVRYIGVDTPESVHPEVPVECYGPEASAENKKLVAGREVVLVRDITERDKYGRLLRYVYVGNTFVNLYLVEKGFAQVVTYPPDVAHTDEYRAAQTKAREDRLGLWGSCMGDGAIDERDYGGGSPPVPGCDIKGNINDAGEKIYHMPGCEYYDKTKISPERGEQWFCTESEAIERGFRKAGNCG